MFEKGEYIIFETAGVCKVVDINTVEMSGIDKKKLFYFLEPVGTKGNRLYIPVENHKSFLRKLVSKEEAKALLGEVKEIGGLHLPDYKHREESYKTALKSCDCKEWMRMLYTLYRKRSELAGKGKKLPAMDSRYLKIAEGCLITELSLALGEAGPKIGDEIAGQVLETGQDKGK